MLVSFAQYKVENRPNSIEPRTVKRRPKAFPLLTKSRDVARDMMITQRSLSNWHSSLTPDFTTLFITEFQ